MAEASATELGITVPSGRREIVRTGFGSGNGDAAAGAGWGAATTTGVSTVPRTSGPAASVVEAGGGAEVWALRSTGCSSLLTTLTLLAWVLSLSRLAPASFEVATVASLGGCTLVGPSTAAIKGGDFGSPGRPPLKAKTEPIMATPAMASAETVQSHRLDRRGAGGWASLSG